ncbi:5-formyltetrahydrofolate cyclo-ligase [Psychrobacter sp. DM4]|uniref:5-formyltetrahydrofolate cyclo-ligase n=1 Tax=Psychrobacter sp. DM4 TaxID=3440637 RepID=UPI003F4F8412
MSKNVDLEPLNTDLNRNLSPTDAVPSCPTTRNPPRRHFTRQRRQLSNGERRNLAQSASLHLTKLKSRLPAKARIGLYYDGFGELPTQPLLDWCQRLNYQAYLPVVGSLGINDKRLRFVPIYHSKLVNVPTRIHSLGMKQNHSRQLLWAKDLDVVICPLVAVDLDGNRMGMGGGFYDTTLGKSYRSGVKKPLKIGWCYDFQVVEQLARQSWDVPLDGLITPSGLRWFQPNPIKELEVETSSADTVDMYLQALGNDDAREMLYYSQEQDFSAKELSKVINEARLNELLAQSDAFIAGLSGEIGDFDGDDELK